MEQIITFVQAHWFAVGATSAYVLLAFVNNLPKPGTKISGYEYFYNVVQTLLNSPVVQKFEQKFPVTVPKTLAEINQLPKGEVK